MTADQCAQLIRKNF